MVSINRFYSIVKILLEIIVVRISRFIDNIKSIDVVFVEIMSSNFFLDFVSSILLVLFFIGVFRDGRVVSFLVGLYVEVDNGVDIMSFGLIDCLVYMGEGVVFLGVIGV